MFGRLVDLLVGINAVIALSAYVGRRWYVRNHRRPSNLEHIKALEKENQEIDDMLEKMK